MATLRVNNFNGMIPATHPTLLPEGCAQIAKNCRIKTGKLLPIKQPKMMDEATIFLENGLSGVELAKSIYAWRHNTQTDGETTVDFLAFPGNVTVAQGNLGEDEYDRVFVTGDTGISFTDADNKVHKNAPAVFLFYRNLNNIIRSTICKVNLPRPVVTNMTHPGNTSINDPNTRYTFFFQTWVDDIGYESGVSLMSENTYTDRGDSTDKSFEYVDGDQISFAAVSSSHPGLPSYASTLKRRIYKVVSGTENSSIQYVGEGPIFSTLILSVKDENAGEVLQEMTSPPPDMKWMLPMTGMGDFYCGFSAQNKRTVMFSEIGIPASWPIAYRYDVKDDIVGLAVTSNTVCVLTNGCPWVISGTAPESMSAAKLATPAACVSNKSICTFRNNVFYATHTGIAMIYNNSTAGTVVEIITDKLFTKEQWQHLNPESCLMDSYDGALHAFFTTKDNEHVGYIIDLNESVKAVTIHDESASCICKDTQEDVLYFVRRQPTEGVA